MNDVVVDNENWWRQNTTRSGWPPTRWWGKGTGTGSWLCRPHSLKFYRFLFVSREGEPEAAGLAAQNENKMLNHINLQFIRLMNFPAEFKYTVSRLTESLAVRSRARSCNECVRWRVEGFTNCTWTYFDDIMRLWIVCLFLILGGCAFNLHRLNHCHRHIITKDTFTSTTRYDTLSIPLFTWSIQACFKRRHRPL